MPEKWISAGTSVRELVKLIEAEGATPAAVAIALDRMEKGTGELSAVQEVEKQYGLPVVAIANLNDLFITCPILRLCFASSLSKEKHLHPKLSFS